MPRFSIGVTTYRRPELLRECIRSVLAQTFTDFEVLIGNDDPGTPVTWESLGLDQNDPRAQKIRILNRPNNLGEIENMQDLLGSATGDYFTWLADDDAHAPRFLEAIDRELRAQPSTVCVYTSYLSAEVPPPNFDPTPTTGKSLSGPDFLRHFLKRELLALGCYAVWEIETLRKAGGMQRLGTGFSPYSDALLTIRSAAAGPIRYVDSPLIFYRTHAGSLSWVRGDLDSYTSAQEDLLREASAVLRAPGFAPDFENNLFELIGHFCVEYSYAVVSRAGSLQLAKWPAYLQMLARHSRPLGARRAELVLRSLFKTKNILSHYLKNGLKREVSA